MVVLIHPKHHLLLHDGEDEEEGGVTDKQNGKRENLIQNQSDEMVG